MQRKPRVSYRIRARIIQLRVLSFGDPLSLDKILKHLRLENWSPIPSRGTVQNIVRQCETLHETILLKSSPFKWNLIEYANLPWNSSEWVLKCKRDHELIEQLVTPDPRTLGWWPFTNNRAKWCWRVHEAAPELTSLAALSVAEGYNFADEISDFVQHGILVTDKTHNLVSLGDQIQQFLNGLLLYKPWSSNQSRLEFVNDMDARKLPWPWQWLGWSKYIYGLGATPPKKYKLYLPSEISREKLAVFPDPLSSITPPTTELFEALFPSPIGKTLTATKKMLDSLMEK